MAVPSHAAPETDRTPQKPLSIPLPSLDLQKNSLDAATDYGRLTGPGQYRRCLDLVVNEPDSGIDFAMSWRDQGGGAPARHCLAIGLIEAGHRAEGARRLEELSKSPDAGDLALRVEILGQAGNAWLLDGNPERAISVLTAGIDLVAEDPSLRADILVYDRARARALLNDWRGVIADLDQVLIFRPDDVSGLVLRARARRVLGDLPEARADLEAALALTPGDPAALIERGRIKVSEGDEDGARQDWANAALAGEGTPLAGAAQNLLADLDVRKGTLAQAQLSEAQNSQAQNSQAQSIQPQTNQIQRSPHPQSQASIPQGQSAPGLRPALDPSVPVNPDDAPARRAVDMLMESGMLSDGLRGSHGSAAPESDEAAQGSSGAGGNR